MYSDKEERELFRTLNSFSLFIDPLSTNGITSICASILLSASIINLKTSSKIFKSTHFVLSKGLCMQQSKVIEEILYCILQINLKFFFYISLITRDFDAV